MPNPRLVRAITIALFWILFTILYYLSQPINSQKNIHIDSNDTSSIITELSNKYNLSVIDKWYMKNIAPPQSGWIYIPSNSPSRLDLLHSLSSTRNKYYKSTLIPGETMPIYLIALGKELNLDPKKLYTQYSDQAIYADGGILADSYHIPSYLKEHAVIKYLLKLSNKEFAKISQEELGEFDPIKWKKILIIASIIQKEAATIKEMNKVSSVIYNRLAKNMRLQMDGTLNYGSYSHIKVTPERIDNDKTTFNTYKHKGLPVSPVCAVSKEAILAAIHPAKTSYLYFMKNKNGTHDFTKYYKTHLKNIKKK